MGRIGGVDLSSLSINKVMKFGDQVRMEEWVLTAQLIGGFHHEGLKPRLVVVMA